jgi:hypothetical protein
MTGRHEELIAGWLDGSLAPAEQEELLAALGADADLARAFAGEVELHRGLQFSASESDEGDRRAADRILHFVRASQEGTRFVEGVKQRALASGRRRPGRFTQPGTSLVGPVLAGAAALLVAALIGGLAFVSHRQKMSLRQEAMERPGQVESEEGPAQARDTAPPAPPPPRVDDEAERRKRIEEELKTAAGKRGGAPPKPKEEKPPIPDDKPVVLEPKPDTPAKPGPTRVETLPALARLEGIQGEVVLGIDRRPAASGAELRDGATVETVGAQSSAVLRFADGTRLELSGEAKLHEKLSGKRSAGKGLTLAHGSLRAEVAKQPAGQSFLFLTPHAEIQVIGTRLSIQSGAETRVDVQEGQVRVTGLKSGQGTTLSAGQSAEAGPAGPPRPFLQGLHAVYFDQNSFKGAAIERVDAVIDLFLDEQKNDLPPVGTDRNFAVRWEGRFLAETAGEYVFTLAVDGQVKFTFAGQEGVSEPRGTFHPIKRYAIRRKLAAGWHDFVLEYSDDQGNSRCGLRYIPPGHRIPDGDLTQGEIPDLEIPVRLFSHHRK